MVAVFELIQVIGAVCALLIGTSILIRRRRSIAEWSFFGGMVLLAVERVCHLSSWKALSADVMLVCQQWSLVCLSLLPFVWLIFSVTYARGNGIELLKKWLPLLVIYSGLLFSFALLWRDRMVVDAVWTTEPGNWVFRLTWAARVLYAGFVVGVVLILMNLEWTFRAAVGTARWKIKYTVLALGLLFGERLYTSSQAILYSANKAQFIFLDALAVVISSLILGFSLYRSRLSGVDIYPSTMILQRSITVLLVAGYLVVTGVVARVVSAFGKEEALPLSALFILISLVGLGVVLFSDRVRQATRFFVSRHFKRPYYDYGRVWSDFTKRTSGIIDRRFYARAVAGLIADVFDVLTVNIWLSDRATNTLVLFASTGLDLGQSGKVQLPEAVVSGLVEMTQQSSEPLDIDECAAPWCELLRQSNPSVFKVGGHRFCVPLMGRDHLEGIIVVGDRVRGLRFSAEDIDLLKQLGYHIAAGLESIGLSEKVAQARELEAFQAMSAFLVHDLKNTVSTLSLTVQNMHKHLENPSFRVEAMRSLERSVAHINDLINRLGTLRQALKIEPRLGDVNEVVNAAIQFVGDNNNQVKISSQLMPVPQLLLDAKQLKSAIVNLLLNARDASPPGSEIIVRTGLQDGGVVVVVRDEGCGMSQDFLTNSLFKPFRTTKKNGLGIGMYQTKAIVEAHHGRITVQSEPGKGTVVRVWIPLPDLLSRVEK